MLDWGRDRTFLSGIDMAWSMRFKDEGRILEILIRGHMSPAEVAEMVRETIGTVATQQLDRVLIDCGDARISVPTLDIYKLPDQYAASGVPRQLRIALIPPRDGYKRKSYEFYEDVCRNRGYFVKLFEQEAEAWDWVRNGLAQATPPSS